MFFIGRCWSVVPTALIRRLNSDAITTPKSQAPSLNYLFVCPLWVLAVPLYALVSILAMSPVRAVLFQSPGCKPWVSVW